MITVFHVSLPELYGELGPDHLYGGSGNDIVIGDIGYAVRRYVEGTPLTNKKTDGADGSNVWHKDIVLEEIGNITAVHDISTQVNNRQLKTEAIMSSSLLFVANAFNSSGEKYIESVTDSWHTDLFTFNLLPNYDDVLHGNHGDDLLFGQRGNDHLVGGNGDDVLIGDAGSNTIPSDMDMPRIYQVYRAMLAPPDSGYITTDATDFGVVFTADYELYPNQYRQVDSLSSIIDSMVTVDDTLEDSNLVGNIIGISALSTTNGYCMKPMFRITPGFLRDTNWMHGDDVLESGSGNNIIIGDDIRGFSGVDLSQLQAIEIARQSVDTLVVDLSVRLSTLEVDTEFYMNDTTADYNISVGCDSITTSADGKSFATGDSLTLIGRTMLGGMLESKVEAILERLRDIELVLVNVHFCLYELHHNVLQRAIENTANQTAGQEPLHHLDLANDIIHAHGNGDIVVGDSMALFYQVDSDRVGFEFKLLEKSELNRLKTSLKGIMDNRDTELDDQVLSHLTPSDPLGNKEQSALPYADVPFYLLVTNDEIHLSEASILGVGDFAFVGLVDSDKQATDSKSLDNYVESIKTLRQKPSVLSFLPPLDLYKVEFYNERYGSKVAKEVKPFMHGDSFTGTSDNNTMLGDFFTGVAFRYKDANDFVYDDKANAFGVYENAEWAQFFDKDTFTVTSGTPVIDSQKGSEKVVGDANTNAKTADIILEMLTMLFRDNTQARQMSQDLVQNSVRNEFRKDMDKSLVCTAPEAAFIPSHTNSTLMTKLKTSTSFSADSAPTNPNYQSQHGGESPPEHLRRRRKLAHK